MTTKKMIYFSFSIKIKTPRSRATKHWSIASLYFLSKIWRKKLWRSSPVSTWNIHQRRLNVHKRHFFCTLVPTMFNFPWRQVRQVYLHFSRPNSEKAFTKSVDTEGATTNSLTIDFTENIPDYLNSIFYSLLPPQSRLYHLRYFTVFT